jgi:hypothetical protein
MATLSSHGFTGTELAKFSQIWLNRYAVFVAEGILLLIKKACSFCRHQSPAEV